MSATSFTPWFWSDWLGDVAVRRLTPAERGLWIDLLALAYQGTPQGYVTDAQGRAISAEEIARLTNSKGPKTVATSIKNILAKGVASADVGPDGEQRLYCRRMVRNADKSNTKSKASKTRWNKTVAPVQQHNGNAGASSPCMPPMARAYPNQDLDLSSSVPENRAR